MTNQTSKPSPSTDTDREPERTQVATLPPDATRRRQPQRRGFIVGVTRIGEDFQPLEEKA
jgi:hypothetical protein